jgi:hypothetical protein
MMYGLHNNDARPTLLWATATRSTLVATLHQQWPAYQMAAWSKSNL